MDLRCFGQVPGIAEPLYQYSTFLLFFIGLCPRRRLAGLAAPEPGHAGAGAVVAAAGGPHKVVQVLAGGAQLAAAAVASTPAASSARYCRLNRRTRRSSARCIRLDKLPPEQMRTLIRELVEKIIVYDDGPNAHRVRVVLNPGKVRPTDQPPDYVSTPFDKLGLFWIELYTVDPCQEEPRI